MLTFAVFLKYKYLENSSFSLTLDSTFILILTEPLELIHEIFHKLNVKVKKILEYLEAQFTNHYYQKTTQT